MAYKKTPSLDPKYLTGIDEIDNQHANLIDLANEVKLTLSKDSSHKHLGNIVKELLSYALYHFKTEEVLMKESGYPTSKPDEAEAHIKAHRRFFQHAAELQEQIRERRQIDSNELIDFLLEWVAEHIQQTDKKLANFILDQKRS